jgi:hypothetical protein
MIDEEDKFKGLLYSPEVLGGIGLLTSGLSGGSPDKALPSLLQGMQTASLFKKQKTEDEKQRLIKEYGDQVPESDKALFKIAPEKYIAAKFKDSAFSAKTFTKKGKEPIGIDTSTTSGKAEARALLKDGWIQTNVGVNSTSIAGVNSKGTNTKLEKEIVDAKGLAVPLSVMKNQFEPEFLTYKGEIGAGFSSFREKMGLGKDDSLQKFTARRNQWLAANNQFFNNYRKAITGVAAGEKEIGYLKQSIPSDDDSASVYMAKLDQQILFNKKLIARNEQAILAGVTPEVDGDGNATGKWKEYLQREENKIKVSKDEVSKMAQAYKDAGFSEKISQFKLIQDFGEETYKQYFNLIK